jgi:hypothetical protein
MMVHPDFVMAQVQQHQHDLTLEAGRHRLLTAARRHRRAARAATEPGAKPVARGRPTGTLAQCEPRAAAPAR